MGSFRPPKKFRPAAEALNNLPEDRKLDLVELLWWCERAPERATLAVVRDLAPLLADANVDAEELAARVRRAIGELKRAIEEASAFSESTA